MFTSFELANALVLDRHQQLRDEAHRSRLASARRRLRRSQKAGGGADGTSTLLRLPARVEPSEAAEERIAS